MRRAGYLGPEGTFSEEALLTSTTPGSLEPVPLASIYDTITALGAGSLDWALVPIENSLDGSIRVTLDLLADRAGEVEIVGESALAVSHSLIAAEQVDLSEIDTVISHPQVPGQCSHFLRSQLPHARVLTARSTAEAVRDVTSEPTGSDRRRRQAALGTVLAAEIYGGTVLRVGVEDRADNETRFVWLARVEGSAGAPPLRAAPSDGWRTSLVFWGAGAESPGWLVRCLDEFAQREINLTKIESRPRRERMGRYMFFADVGGRLGDEAVSAAIAGLAQVCEEVRVLGSYPAAGELPRPGG
jgi:prephenate dehydratase